MSPDDEGGFEPRRDPEGVGGPPPQPADRPWVHPSELQSFVATPGAAPAHVRPREWAVGLGSAIAASVVTILVLVAFGALGNGSRSAPAPQPAFVGTPSGVDYSIARRIAADTAPSVVRVRIVGSDGAVQPVGSGVAVASDRVVTNAHLLGGAPGLDVVTYDGTDHPAKVVGTDPQTDLAVLSVADADLTAVAQGDAGGIAVGGTVVAVAANRSGGYRTDIDVISDQNRLVDAGSGAMVAGAIETGIQPGAAWAGGALVDVSGNLVGVLTTDRMRAWRRGMIFGLFVFAALITPSQDPFTFTFMAIPLCLLYEVCIIIGRLRDRSRRRQQAQDGLAALADDEASRLPPPEPVLTTVETTSRAPANTGRGAAG